MIPFLLAAVGGYLIGDSMKDSEKFADGGIVRAWDEASRKAEELKYKDYVLRQPNKNRDESWYNTTRKIKEERISINSKIDALKKEYFESEEGKSELSKAIKFLNDIGIKSRWNGREDVALDIGHLHNWWLEDAKTGDSYIGNQDAEQLIKFATSMQNFYKGLSVEQIKAKRELERKQEEISRQRQQAREDNDDNKWIVKYISTDDNDVASVWVIAENREDAIEQAKEDNWDIGEIISVAK